MTEVTTPGDTATVEPGKEPATGATPIVDAAIVEPEETGKLGEQGEKALKAARAEKKAVEKTAKEAQTKLKEYEDKDKTQNEKDKEESEANQLRADKAEREVLRLKVAQKKNLPAEIAERLVGDTQEEMEKDADKLMKSISPATRVRSGLDQGPRSSNSGKTKTMNDFIRTNLFKQ